jgi:hypothetical protein
MVLVTENKQQYLIPKRAFASEADLQAFRALLQNKITQTTFLTEMTGFAVLPKPAIAVGECKNPSVN